MDCSCHEPAVFGHLECDLAPRGHMSEHAVRLRRAMVLNQEMDATMAIREAYKRRHVIKGVMPIAKRSAG